MKEPRVEISELRVVRGKREVLTGCTADLGPGVTVLVGGNGAGKSTLLQAICGLQPATAGRITLNGEAVGRGGLNRRLGARLGYLPQDPHLTGSLTVRNALDYSLWLHRGVGENQPTDAGEVTLDRLGLSQMTNLRLDELSGGMNRLAMLAATLVHDPSIIVLDEATAGVDLDHRSRFRQCLIERKADATILLSSHLSDDIEHLADRVLVLSGGLFVFDGTPTDLQTFGDSVQVGAESRVEAALRRLTSAPVTC